MARDTPGRDAYMMRQAARKKTTNNMLGQRNAGQRLAASMAAKPQREGGLVDVFGAVGKGIAHSAGNYLRNTLAAGQAPKGRSGLARVASDPRVRGVSQASKVAFDVAVGPETGKALTGAGKYSPLLAGVELAGAFARPVKGGKVAFDAMKPAARVATKDPAWEIIRNKSGDIIVGMQGREREWIDRTLGGSAVRFARNQHRNLLMDAQEGVGQIAQYDEAIRQAMLNQSRRDVENAMARRKEGSIGMTFSAVPAGTDQAQASLKMMIRRRQGDTYVPWVSKLADPETASAERRLIMQMGLDPAYYGYQAQDVPFPVMMQLMQNAMGPERPIAAWVVNEKLKRMLSRYTESRGIPFRDEPPDWASLGVGR